MSTKAVRKDLVITRLFDAPRDLVFKCWTNPAHLRRWFGPRGFHTDVDECDARPGGKLRGVMRGPNGVSHQMYGEFREVVPLERLVLTSMVNTLDGPDFVVTQTVTFEAAGARTKVTLRAHVDKLTPAGEPYADGMQEGWTQTLDKLAELVANPDARSVLHDTFRIEREFKAPVSLVYDAWASQEAKARWFVVPDRWERGNYELEFRVGGRESLSVTPPGEPVHRVESVYQDIVRDSRIIYTYSMWVGEAPVCHTLVTIEFHKTASGTRLTLTEQGALLDGLDIVPARGGGTYMLDNLEAEIHRQISQRTV